VKTLLNEQSYLREEQQAFQEQLRDSEHIQSKLKASLTTLEGHCSKVAQILLASTEHSFNALEDEKDEFN